MGDFFDDIDLDDINWASISPERIEKIINKLSKQDTETVFNELKKVIDDNNRVKSVIDVSVKVLQTLVSLGLKVL